MPLFDGRITIVTGGSSGIGQAACYLYAHDWADKTAALEYGKQGI